MPLWLRVLRAVPVLVVAPFFTLLSWAALSLTDILFALFGRHRRRQDTKPNSTAATIVIPNWNGRDLLEKYLPSVVAAAPAPHEILVVDNGSTDGSAEYLRQNFPQVTLLPLSNNLGFGGGSNAGFRAAKNDIVVLLNSDMRVEPDFLAPLLQPFATDASLFAVACQIFFSDANKRREETGLTECWWENGNLRTAHREDDQVTEPFPCFYPGGGSSAIDRRKFLEIGGFDSILEPFYLEDTDLGFMAWKRGWKILYQPASKVFHEHRGTIGKKFSQTYIQSILKKNFYLFAWKNIHQPSKLVSHFYGSFLESTISLFAGDSGERANFYGLFRAVLQLPAAMAARWSARSFSEITDEEAFRRPLGGYFRDRFLAPARVNQQPAVLFLSPYPICPPIHGGGVFMYHSVKELAANLPLHLLVILDNSSNQQAHAELDQLCASTTYIEPFHSPQKLGSIDPHSVTEFYRRDIAWLIHRIIYTQQVDVLQIDYTNLGVYRLDFQHLVCALFEHDVFFQSIRRGLPHQRGFAKFQWAFEFLRVLRYELRELPEFDQIQVCSPANRDYLLSYLPQLKDRMHAGMRAGVPLKEYRFYNGARQAKTLLFLGSFRHLPNQIALEWFLREVFPLVLAQEPDARLAIIGSDPPPPHALPGYGKNVDLIGFVEDIKQPLRDYAVFVCPILTGSGVRVKLLEAFAAGIPVVSTRLGAEGLAENDTEFCRLADEPQAFAQAIVDLFLHPEAGRKMAERAYEEMLLNWDTPTITKRLIESYRQVLNNKLPKQ
jgi:O-antigen biosynthesis protein